MQTKFYLPAYQNLPDLVAAMHKELAPLCSGHSVTVTIYSMDMSVDISVFGGATGIDALAALVHDALAPDHKAAPADDGFNDLFQAQAAEVAADVEPEKEAEPEPVEEKPAKASKKADKEADDNA